MVKKSKKSWQTLIILGSQWGDEGKGKIADYYGNLVDYVVRFQGGNNAGHTLVVEGEVYKLHLIPSGVLHEDKIICLGNGMVIDPEILITEIDNLEAKGMKLNMLISERAHIIFPFHILMDGMIDEYKGNLGAGTTRRGIGPCYADKAERSGIRMIDLMNKQIFKEKFNKLFELKKQTLEKLYKADIDLNKNQILKAYLEFGQRLKPYVGDVSYEINKAIDNGKKIMLEGAQGTMLDNDFGAYPHTTSSNTTAGGACVGAGISPVKIDRILGVVKAYTSRVGDSPLPTEIFGSKSKYLQDRGQEFGTTTGRPRRMGWLDMVQLRYSQRINGFTGLAVTKIDILGGLKKIPVCTHYKYKSTKIEELPADLDFFRKCKPVYKQMDGWKDLDEEDFKAIIKKGYAALPVNMKKYLKFLETEMGAPIEMVSVGPDRKMTIEI
ncbi:adenylosuccinate synthase [Patescibacteria group bacterium]|nr:adenylosuccinate synthase [Patescibacteria group bacterium]